MHAAQNITVQLPHPDVGCTMRTRTAKTRSIYALTGISSVDEGMTTLTVNAAAPSVFSRIFHDYYAQKIRISRLDKPRPILLSSGLGLLIFGLLLLMMAGDRRHHDLDNAVTALLTCGWCAITGIVGLFAACWCPSGKANLECYHDVEKCLKKRALLFYRAYTGCLAVLICFALALIIHSVVAGILTVWDAPRGEAELFIVFGIILLLNCPMFICMVLADKESFIEYHNREHGGHEDAEARIGRPIPHAGAHSLQADTVSLPPQYSDELSRGLLPTYEMAELEEPLLCSTLTIQNGKMVELPPSYSQIVAFGHSS
ncbi:uncharacterized protein LOC129587565 [Paramacrobiotus metropolitanus]|uniref:uncharacterized protein LOC129587565 n=1 Tax=Paramacrobiotus metropolitanus TaxID=2943436 RepID=UPI0024463FB3|nr:uncharacterized protein LOC129587565 [Paramacrobiotus metropolitanus]